MIAMEQVRIDIYGKHCKWCTVTEDEVISMDLLSVDRHLYCPNEDGHEWID